MFKEEINKLWDFLIAAALDGCGDGDASIVSDRYQEYAKLYEEYNGNDNKKYFNIKSIDEKSQQIYFTNGDSYTQEYIVFCKNRPNCSDVIVELN